MLSYDPANVPYLTDMIRTLPSYVGEMDYFPNTHITNLYYVYHTDQLIRIVFTDYTILVDSTGILYVKYAGTDEEVISYYNDGGLRNSKVILSTRRYLYNLISDRIYKVFMNSQCTITLIKFKEDISSSEIFHKYFVDTGLIPIKSLSYEQRQCGGYKQ